MILSIYLSICAEFTIFFFDVPSPYLIPAMERFAEFFISPLFKSDCVERELKAVHSEFVDSKNIDYHRRGAVQCATAKPDHPFAKFGWSALHSLALTLSLSSTLPPHVKRPSYIHTYVGAIWNL
jgi:secreted Zn-dependent insulinase-like peptidase